ncbi:response regulator transcription factor [Bordetella petrii]|uniref:response regulator transcription factor n=1 Tax=Bordetella petrii TaxID=94624 RepID=UPI001A968516|nr:winged helix-turn-helix domain-containing protein [Bordetella petrii]MBO1113995.1 response regulator transcription factor [Bordetella petrii]
MNNSLDVLFLVGDDTTHPQQIADLEHLGFQIHRYTELAELYTHVAQHPVSLIVLTGSLPKIHIAAAQLRAMRHTLGIIVLATFADSEARVRTLLCGADACLDIAASGLELAAVFQSLLRRVAEIVPSVAAETAAPKMAAAESGTSAAEPAEPAPAAVPGWRLASKGWTLIAPTGQELALTTAERSFLLRLVRAPDKKVSRETLIADGVQSGEAAEGERRGRFVDVMISRMRRKAAVNHMRLPIKAVHGWGYMFTADVAEEAGAPDDGGAASA